MNFSQVERWRWIIGNKFGNNWKYERRTTIFVNSKYRKTKTSPKSAKQKWLKINNQNFINESTNDNTLH